MTKLQDLLNPEAREALGSIATDAVRGTVTYSYPAIEACACKSRQGFSILPGTTLAVCSTCRKPTAQAIKTLGHVYAQHLTAESAANAVEASVLVLDEPKVQTLTGREIAAVVNSPEDAAPDVTGKHALPYDPALDPEPVLLEELDDLLAVVRVPELAPVTTINGVEVDLRGDAMHETECVDCHAPVKVEIAPAGVDLAVLTSTPRVVVCTACGKARTKGKQGVVVRKPRVAKPQPRTTDGQEHPVVVTKKKEESVDLSGLSKARLADVAVKARDNMVAEAAEETRKKAKAAKKAQRKAETAEREAREAERASRKGLVLPGFTIKGVEVPALDLSDLTVGGLDEAVSAKERSPYNKALFRTGQPILAKPDSEQAIKGATWADLAVAHRALAKLASEAEAKPVPTAQIAADLAPDAPAKVSKEAVEAFQQVFPHLSKKQARAILANA